MNATITEPTIQQEATINLADLLPWSEPKRIETRNGPRMLRKADPDDRFWAAWRGSKQVLKDAGVSVGNRDGRWEVCWWQMLDAKVVEAEKKAVEASRATDAEVDLPCPAGLAYLPYQRAGTAAAVRWMRDGKVGVLIGDEMGLGKAQPLDSKVLTPAGWKLMGDVHLGDLVVGADGKPTRVIGVFPHGEKNCYRVTFSDGSQVQCCDEHLWQVSTAADRWKRQGSTVKSLGEIRDSLLHENGNSVHFIPMVEPVAFKSEPLTVSPYVIGVILGDGHITQSVRISNIDYDVLDHVRSRLPDRCQLRRIAQSKCDWQVTSGGQANKWNPNPVMGALRQDGLHGKRAHEKFIPKRYLMAAIEDRIDLLRGLLDSDGECREDGCVVFSTVSEQLARDVQFLVWSIGGNARLSTRTPRFKTDGVWKVGRLSYVLVIAVTVNPFYCTRKADRWSGRDKYPPSRAFRSIEFIGRKPMQCIKVDAQDQLYVTDDFVVTHNTIQAIGIANAEPSIRKVLVVCPASLKLNWKREFEKWTTTGLRCGLATSKFWPGDAVEVVIVNYDILKQCRERLLAATWDLLIADECHFLKNPKAQRTLFLLGSKTVEPVKARFRAYLTGTPIVNRPKEMFGLINSLDPKTFPSFWTYGKRYCGATHNGFGWDFSGASHLDELQHKLRASCMIRRLKKDVLTELPPKRRQVIELPAEGRLANLVAQEWEIREKAEERLGEIRTRIELAKCAEDLDGYTAAVEELRAGEKAAFEEGAVVAHEIAMAKVPDVIAHVREAIEEGKVILFAHHLDVIDAYKEEFGAAAVVVDGRVKIEDRQAAVDRFQTDPNCTVFIGGMKAAGVGLTLTASSHVVFGEIDWVPGNMSQAEDRAHRIGQTDSVLVQIMVLEGSLDAHKVRTLIRKMDVIDRALDRRHPTGAPETGTTPETVRVVLAKPEERKRLVRSLDVSEPVDGVKRETVSWEELDAEAEKITDEQVARIHEGLQILAGMCDGAREIDGAGFNKFDTLTGKALAYQGSLTKRQALLGRKLCRKYSRQLGRDFVESCGITLKPNRDE